MLIAEGLLNQDQLDRALKEQKRLGGRLGSVLRSLKYVTEEDIIRVLGRQMGIPHMALSSIIIDPDVIELVPELAARRHQVLPLFKKAGALTLAMADPLNVFAIDDIQQATGCRISPVVVTEEELLRAIDRYYGGPGVPQGALRETELRPLEKTSESPADSAVPAEDSPVIKFVNTLIAQAVKEGASDIHVEPEGETIRIRYRVDGLLRDVMTVPKALQAGIASRIKVMADLDIAERRVPQDGRVEVDVAGKPIDIRLSTLPSILGEKIVMRLLDKGSVLLGLKELGFSEATLPRFERLAQRPYGLILVTGATGSGKTTTLYSLLQSINTPEKNIVTIEDPVEYQLKRITQVQVNPKAGITFANGLRSILRQDPDVVMVGEIRDRETATIAIQAALTGHLVMSTLHTNDAAGAVARLVDMGAEPFLIASALTAVVAQKLVRKICQKCKTAYLPPRELIEELGLASPSSETDQVSWAKGTGCKACRASGYTGRIGIYELLPIDDAVRALVISRSSSSEIRKLAHAAGNRSLRIEGLAKVFEGITTLEEILRVTQDIEEFN